MQAIIQQRGFCKSQKPRAYRSALDLTTTSLATLEYRIRRLTETFEDLTRLTAEYYNYSHEYNWAEPDDLHEYERKFYETHSKLSGAVADATAAQIHSSTPNATVYRLERLATSQAEFLEHMRSSNSSDFRCDKIKIPTFSGNYEDWPQSCDLFLGSIGNRSNFTSCQKCHYLKSYLARDALNLVKHIAVTEENYTGAWERLVTRYDKKQSFVNSFLSMPSVSGSGAASLRKLADGADEAI